MKNRLSKAIRDYVEASIDYQRFALPGNYDTMNDKLMNLIWVCDDIEERLEQAEQK